MVEGLEKELKKYNKGIILFGALSGIVAGILISSFIFLKYPPINSFKLNYKIPNELEIKSMDEVDSNNKHELGEFMMKYNGKYFLLRLNDKNPTIQSHKN